MGSALHVESAANVSMKQMVSPHGNVTLNLEADAWDHLITAVTLDDVIRVLASTPPFSDHLSNMQNEGTPVAQTPDVAIGAFSQGRERPVHVPAVLLPSSRSKLEKKRPLFWRWSSQQKPIHPPRKQAKMASARGHEIRKPRTLNAVSRDRRRSLSAT